MERGSLNRNIKAPGLEPGAGPTNDRGVVSQMSTRPQPSLRIVSRDASNHLGRGVVERLHSLACDVDDLVVAIDALALHDDLLHLSLPAHQLMVAARTLERLLDEVEFGETTELSAAA